MRRITTDSLSNQNIATALLLATYTADADRMLYISVRADQVAGAGDYVVYLTRQHLGDGSHFRHMPQTTATVPSGVTAIAFPSIGLPVKSTDVIKVYLTGLAGDTTTPDTVVEWWEDEMFITVGAAGAGLTAVGDTAGTTTLLSRVTALLQTKAEADTAHALLATAAALASAAGDVTTLLSRVTGAVALATSTTAAAIRSALGMAAANLDDQLDALPTNAELATALAAADDAVLAAITALNDLSSADAQTAAAAALVAYDATVPADLAGLSTLTASQVWAAITTAAANIIADHVIRRGAAAAFASANGDALPDAANLLGVIMRGVHADTTTNPGFLTVFDPNGGELAQISLTPDAAADPTVALG